ncbi:uncharacterized protein LOC124197268 [Daphnia pulex]|uniref:uncharacterized protein LOC124197268 n=1 Tax=Daphnia pulex TaxID=6669 RepID=UPI001EDCB39F|nr:uncharacterized protein LOC124197268 [Daphnia pulex]XP_046641371.1 uncharacterized protein LOC124326519 [Daphnia pulicaria]
MSSGYQALLKSLDETERDVSRGLGRSVKIRKPRKCCCCSGAAMWTCLALVIVCGLVISVGLPILLTVPVDSSWHWKHWMPWANRVNSSTNDQHLLLGAEGEDSNGTVVWSGLDLSSEPEADLAVNNNQTTTSVKFIHDAITHLHQMMEWTREQYDKTPKIPLIIGLSALLLVIMTIIWLVVYRKIRRRQRRRTIGKLVTDLQSGKTLLNSDDSEDE